jgi:protein TonB
MAPLALVRTRHDVLSARLSLLREGEHWPLRAAVVAAFTHALIALVLPHAVVTEPFVASPPALEVFPVEPVEVAKPAEPPEPEPPPLAPEPEPPPLAEAARREVPVPAAAAAALTQTAPAEQTLDLTDELVTGSALTYSGGTTARVAPRERRGPARASGSLGSSSAKSAGTGDAAERDLSRAPSVLGGLDWRCPFPEEANAAGVDRALAKVHVVIDAEGRVRHARIVEDPGHGFGGAARSCALGKRFQPALDREGRATTTRVTVGVRFVR